jgi:diguanylate cyclase (GGDEF)-like protein
VPAHRVVVGDIILEPVESPRERNSSLRNRRNGDYHMVAFAALDGLHPERRPWRETGPDMRDTFQRSFLSDNAPGDDLWIAPGIKAVARAEDAAPRRILSPADVASLLHGILVAQWTTLSSVQEMVYETAMALARSALGIERLSLVTLPVYSAYDGVQYVWTRDAPDRIRTLIRPAGFLDDPEHLASPLHAVLTSGTRLRQRLCAAEGVERFTFLADLSRSGCTDYIAVPLPTRRATAHVLSLATRQPDGWRDADLDAFDHFLSAFAMLVEVWECERLLETAATDALTKVASRRAFEAALRHGWSTCARTGVPLSLVSFDIDQFKSFNDTYGHVAGDRCLARVAAAAQDCALRGSDILARLGGEEFALLLPISPAAGARTVAERVRAAVIALAIPHAASWVAPHVTVSVGTATVVPDTGSERTRLLELADAALYRAKAGGRNRIESAQGE